MPYKGRVPGLPASRAMRFLLRWGRGAGGRGRALYISPSKAGLTWGIYTNEFKFKKKKVAPKNPSVYVDVKQTFTYAKA